MANQFSPLARDFERALDPTIVMRHAGMQPDDWQRDLLQSTADRHLILCSRQAGKSTAVGALAVSTALDGAGLVLLIAPAQRQSVELFRKVRDMYVAQPDAPKIVTESALRMELENGSRIIALPGTESTIRGYSAPKLIIVDEASRVEDGLFTGIRPMLATNQGRMICLTTPYGKRGFFYEAWAHGEGWKHTIITADQCPRIDAEWLANERKMIGEWQYRQEFLCEFVDTDESFFSSDLIEAAMQDTGGALWS